MSQEILKITDTNPANEYLQLLEQRYADFRQFISLTKNGSEGTYNPGYTTEMTAFFLAYPEITHTSLRERMILIRFFEALTKGRDLFAKEDIIERKEYAGRWYCQGYEPTCTPWSLVNACVVIRVEPEPECIAQLLNRATGITCSKTGIDWEDVAGLYPVLPANPNAVRFSKADLDWQLWQLDPENISSTITHNTAVIKHFSDKNVPIVSTVIPGDFYPRGELRRHGICICGYRLFKNSGFDVQVIDSNIGIIWVPVEHLAKSLVSGNTFVLENITQNIS